MNREGDGEQNRKKMLGVLLRLGLVAAVGVATTLFTYHLFNRPQTERPYEDQPVPPRRGSWNGTTSTSSRSGSPGRKKRQGGQKRKLTDELCSNTAECFCTEVINAEEEVFSCDNCYNIFHLWCIKQWAAIGWADEGKWCCPVCKKYFHTHPRNLAYKCMCGQTQSPVSHPGVTPHCCTRSCPKCGESCHPGRCDGF